MNLYSHLDNEISKKFFGLELNEDFENVILTNIQPIFQAFVDYFQIKEFDRGFYQNCKISFKNKTYRLIKINSGSCIIDVLKILGKSKEIILVGLAGALNPQYEIGQIICPAKATSFENIEELKNFTLPINQSGLVCQVDGMLQDNDTYKQLLNSGVNLVDMESYYFASFCQSNKIASGLIALISDQPLLRPFYEVENFKVDIDKILEHIN